MARKTIGQNPLKLFDDDASPCSTTSSNGFTKCATNNESARVPDTEYNSANVMNPTNWKNSKANVLESRMALLDNSDKFMQNQKQFNSSSFLHAQTQLPI